MATELSHSRGEDPFGSSSIFSLLPQTLGPCSNAPIAASYAEELDSIDTFFRSMVVKGSKQLVQQAQTITKSFTDSHSLYPNDEKLAAKLKDHPQERRPALGRKRATFSLKPAPSFLPNLEISSTIDHIQDPEEYFKTIQELENAEKELKKLRGEVSPGPVECHQVTTARKRRPGLLGKSASYKHHISAGDIMETSAQEVPHDRRIPSLSNTPTSMELCSEIHTEPIGETHVSQAKNRGSKLQDVAEGRDSSSGKEKNISNLLEKLLTSCKDFGGDEGNTFLRESLQMKSIDTRKICLPELGDVQISQHTASKIIARRGESPTLAKSPLEAISALQRRFPLINPLKDLYSVYPTDDAPSSGDNSLIKSRGKVSHSLVNALNQDDSGLSFDNQSSLEESATKLDFQDEICLPVVEVGSSIGKKSISEEKHTENPHHFEVNTNPDIDGVVDDRDGLADGLQEEVTDRQVDTIISNQRDVLVDGLSVGVEGLSGINQLTAQVTLEQPSQLLGTNTDCDTNQFYGLKNLSGGFDGYLHEKGNKMLQDTLNKIQPNAGESLSSSCVNCTTTECLASPPNRDLDNNCNNSGANVETGFSGYNDISQSEANVTILAKAAHTRASEDLSRPSEAATLTGQNLENIRSRPEENNEGHQTTSRAPQNEESRQKEPQRTKNKKKYTARQSLAGAGMVWENGKRRSSRHRFRPLEHWRGERFLYGRIHDSLATVIGVKYASPGKGGLKVESYVPEKYADLVAQAGRY